MYQYQKHWYKLYVEEQGHATGLLKDTTNPIMPANGYFVDMRFGKPFTDKEKFTKIFNEMTKKAGCPPEFTELYFLRLEPSQVVLVMKLF